MTKHAPLPSVAGDDVVVTFDIDGVIAGGRYIPEWERFPEVYMELPLLDPSAPEVIHEVAKKYSVYLISSRSYPQALSSTRLWLNKVGFYMPDFSGVLVGLTPHQKAAMASLLGSVMHLDDDWRVVWDMGEAGVLFDGDSEWVYPPDKETIKLMRKIHGWDAVMKTVDDHARKARNP